MITQKDERIGQTNLAKIGLMMTIIAYKDCNDIDIQFEDGVIVRHKRYRNFLSGNIIHPDYSAHRKVAPDMILKRIGETNKSNRTGMMMTIIEYRNCHDIDVKFENGEIVQHCDYQSFTRGQIILIPIGYTSYF